MKLFKKVSDYWDRHKNIPLFKGKALAVIVLIAAIIINYSRY